MIKDPVEFSTLHIPQENDPTLSIFFEVVDVL